MKEKGLGCYYLGKVYPIEVEIGMELKKGNIQWSQNILK